MKLRSISRAVSGALTCLALILTGALRAADSDLGALRAKAESGNAIAQYNLGMAYLDGQQVPKDIVEAYVWLTLAAENGSTGKALKTLAPTLSADQIAAAETRLAGRRTVISNHLLAQNAAGAAGAVAAPRAVRTPDPAPAPAAAAPAPAPAPAAGPASAAAVPAADAGRVEALAKELATVRADNAKLSAEIISVWKDLDAAKVAEVAAARRADRADVALKQSASEAGAITAERDQLRQQLAAALAAAKPAATAPDDPAQRKALAAAEDARAKAATALESAQRELAAIKNVNKELVAQVDRLAAENASVKVQLAAGGAVSRKLEEAQAALVRLRAENAELKTKPAAPPAADEARTKAVAALESARRELVASQAASKDLVAKVDRLAAEGASLRNQLAASGDVSRKLEEAQAALVRLQAENVELKARPAPAAEVSPEEFARLKQELARAKQTVEMTVRSYALSRQENEQLKARLEKIQQAAGGASDAAAKPAPAPATR